MDKVKALKSLIWLILVILFLKFYFVDVAEKFSNDIRSFSEYEETVSSIEMPALTFCPEPRIIPEKAEKYGINEYFFRYPIDDSIKSLRNVSKNMTFNQLYHESHFTLQKDFDIFAIDAISFGPHSDFTKGVKLNIGKNTIQIANDGTYNITVFELATTWHGLCYSILSDFKISTFKALIFGLGQKHKG